MGKFNTHSCSAEHQLSTPPASSRIPIPTDHPSPTVLASYLPRGASLTPARLCRKVCHTSCALRLVLFCHGGLLCCSPLSSSGRAQMFVVLAFNCLCQVSSPNSRRSQMRHQRLHYPEFPAYPCCSEKRTSPECIFSMIIYQHMSMDVLLCAQSCPGWVDTIANKTSSCPLEVHAEEQIHPTPNPHPTQP